MNLGEFVKERRKLVKLTQPELALKAGVGLRFQVLQTFGHEFGPVPQRRDIEL